MFKNYSQPNFKKLFLWILCMASWLNSQGQGQCPIADFTFSPIDACADISIQFTVAPISDQPGLKYEWDFGDGSKDSNKNPQHLFQITDISNPQIFQVKLTITDTLNNCPIADTMKSVSVRPLPLIKLLSFDQSGELISDDTKVFENCTEDEDGGRREFTIRIFDDSRPPEDIMEYRIDWGDNRNVTIPAPMTSIIDHTYENAGIYDLTYTVVRNNGCERTQVFSVVNVPGPKVSLSADSSSVLKGCAPRGIRFNFTNFENNDPSTIYEIETGDNSFVLEDLPPTLFYEYDSSSCGIGLEDDAFSFTITARIPNTSNCNSSESVNLIKVFTKPEAAFTTDENNYCKGERVTFENETITGFNSACSGSTTYRWDFDDGTDTTVFTTRLLSHIYQTPGSFNVRLVASNDCDSTDAFKTINICDGPPQVLFTVNELSISSVPEGDSIPLISLPGNGCAPGSLTLTSNVNEVIGCNNNYSWSIEETNTGYRFENSQGTTSTQENERILFEEGGVYTIRLQAMNACDNTVSQIRVIVQSPPVAPTIQGLESPYCEGEIINLNITPSPLVNRYEWKIEGITDTNFSTPTSLGNTFSTANLATLPAGEYRVIVSAINNCDSINASETFEILPPPVASISPAGAITVCEGESRLLTANSGIDLEYEWLMNGSRIDTATNQAILVSEAGAYQVVIRQGECVDTSSAVNITLASARTFNISTTNPTNFCVGDAIEALLEIADAPDSLNYQWELNGEVIDSGATFLATELGTYRAILTEGECSKASENVITIDTIPSVPVRFAADTLPRCNADAILTLPQAEPLGGFWSEPEQVELLDSLAGTFSVDSVGIFTFTYTFINTNTGCISQGAIDIEVQEPEEAQAGLDTSICQNDMPYLLGGTPASGVWKIITNQGEETLANGIFDPSQYDTITHTLIYSVGQASCADQDTLLITVLPPPVVDAGMSREVCEDVAAFPLNGSPTEGGMGEWFEDGEVSNGIFNPQVSGLGEHILIYRFTDDSTNCTVEDTITIRVNPVPNAQFDPEESYCIGEEITFVNLTPDDLGVGLTYEWDFGDITTTTSKDGVHTYTQADTFLVTLTVRAGNCIDIDTHRVIIIDRPVASFEIEPDTVNSTFCGSTTLNFDASASTGQNLTYAWDFNNDQIIDSEEANPQDILFPASITQDTTYTIRLTVTQNGISGSCTKDSTTRTITIKPKPDPRFIFEFNPTCSGFPLTIDNFSVGNPELFIWDYGDGSNPDTTTESGSFTHQFFYEGTTDTTYQVKLTAINGCGRVGKTMSIKVLPKKINAFFRVNPDTVGCAPFPVSLSLNQLGLNTINIDYDNGKTTSELSDTTALYEFPGEYTIELVITNGCDIDTFSRKVIVHPSPTAFFRVNKETLCINEPLIVNNQSDTFFDSSWVIDDGDTIKTVNLDPVFFSSLGEHILTLTVRNEETQCTHSFTKTITVIDQPEALINPLPTICEDTPIEFSHSSRDAVRFQWNFGETEGGSFDANPIYTYQNPGEYIVQLIVWNNEDCSDTTFQTITIAPKPESKFTPFADFACGFPNTLSLSNQSEGALSYEWLVNGVFQEDTQDVELTFDAAGTYTITLVAISDLGCRDESSIGYEVLDIPTITIEADTQRICAGETVAFSNLSNNATEFLWDFGDGFTSQDREPTHTYNDPGSYLVTLTATNQGRCEQSTSVNEEIVINVLPIPEADFSFNCVANPDFRGEVEFFNNVPSAVRYEWSFGDGNTSTDSNPVHTYARTDTFTVTLITYNEFGCPSLPAQEEVNLKLFGQLTVPNTFIPGHPNPDIGCFRPKGVNLREYSLQIYDHWGNQLWETTLLDENGSPVECWPGTEYDQGAYTWKIEAVFIDGTPWPGQSAQGKGGAKRRAGSFNLIR